MYGKICFKIADHTIEIFTKERRRTMNLLPNFKLFLTPGVRKGEEPLFSLYGNHQIAGADFLICNEVEWNNSLYKVYNCGSSKLVISMTIDGREHFLKIDLRSRIVTTDMTLTLQSEREHLHYFLVIAYELLSSPLKSVKLNASILAMVDRAYVFLVKTNFEEDNQENFQEWFPKAIANVHTGKPVLRVMSDDSVWVFRTPWCHLSEGQRTDRGPVAGIMSLEKSDQPEIIKLTQVEAFDAVVGSASMTQVIPEQKREMEKVILEILKTVPVYQLRCKDIDEAIELTQSLTDDTSGKKLFYGTCWGR